VEDNSPILLYHLQEARSTLANTGYN